MSARRGTLVLAVVAVSQLAGTALPTAGKEGRRAGRVHPVSSAPGDMVPIPSGGFTMGAPDSEDELAYILKICKEDYQSLSERFCIAERYNDARPQREVFLESFEIDRHEVTVAEYRACVRAKACDVGALLFGDQRYNRSDWPIGNVTWDDARDYCAWRGKRLPTEAEWEKAARGSKAYRWPWGQSWRGDGSNHGRITSEAVNRSRDLRNQEPDLAPDDSDGHSYAAPPGSMVWGESPYGVMDMAGNVSEWVEDFYSDQGYADLPTIDPVRDSPVSNERRRVIRGGAWNEPRLMGLTYDRFASAAGSRSTTVGFRCAR